MRKDAVEELYCLYAPTVYKYLMCLCHDPSLAEDLTADTFEAALRGIHKFRGEAKLSVWLCSIAKRKYYQHLRRNGRIQAVPLEDAPLISPQDIEGEYLRQADKIDLNRALQALPPDLPGDGGRYASCSHRGGSRSAAAATETPPEACAGLGDCSGGAADRDDLCAALAPADQRHP